MSKLQRFNSFIGGLLSVLFGFALYMAPFMGVDMISAVMTTEIMSTPINGAMYRA